MVVLVQLEDVDPEVGAVAELVHHQVGILGVLDMSCSNDFLREEMSYCLVSFVTSAENAMRSFMAMVFSR